MKTNTYMNYAKRLVIVLAVGLMAVNVWGETYNKITSLASLTTGDYVIVGQKGASSWGKLDYGTPDSKSRLAYTADYTSSLPASITTTDANEVWYLTVSGTGDSRTVTIYNAGESVYMNASSAISWDASNATSWTVAYSNGFQFAASSTYLGVNSGANYWRDYAYTTLYNSNTYCITLYKAPSGDAITLDKNTTDDGSTAGAGTIAADATNMTIGTTPTRAGYHVEGYYTAATEGTKIATAAGALQPNVTVSATTWTNGSSQWKKGGAATFYTYWEANSYQVAFDKNGGTGSMENETGFKYGTAKALTECGFTAPAHKYFLGWNTDKNATTATYADKAEVSTLTTENNGTVTLYAIWKDYSYQNYRTRCCVKLDAPENVEVSVTGTQAATVTWDAVTNASGYEYTLDAGEHWTAATSPLSLTSAQGLVGATSYAIQVRATGDGTTYCADGTATDAVNFKTWSTVTAASNDDDMGSAQVSLTSGSGWASSVAAADGTKIYLKATATSDSYEWYEWATPASGSINGDNEFTGWEGDVTVTANFRTKSLEKLATPTGMASSSVTAISAVVSWTAVEHASGYTVTCEKTDDHSTTGIVIGDVDGTSCTISGLTANTGYTWTVKAVGDNSSYKDGDACEGKTFTTDKKKPATVEITTAPTKTTYNSGETFDATGMVVKVTYNNGDIDAAYTGYTISKETALSPSDTYVTITATMNEVSASVNQAITVNAKLTWKAAGAEDVYTYASSGKVVMPTGEDPTAPSCLGDFDTFQGWSASAIAVSTDVEPTYVSAETDATTDATFYAVFAKMGDGDVEDANSVFTVNAAAPGSPYVASDGATWTYSSSGITFNGGASSCLDKEASGWIQVVLPSSATEAASYVITKTTNSWAADAAATLTSGSTEIATISNTNNRQYTFTNSDKGLGTYKLTNVSSTKKACWIDYITINYKKVGQVPVEWATTCCTEWSAPAISYDVPSGWKNGDAAVSVSIAEGDTYGAVTYESSNTDVLTVAADGSITAVAPGTATVTATWAGATVGVVKYCEASSTSAEITVTGTLTIQFVGGTGTTGSMDNQTVTYNVAEAISNNGFSKAGHTFAGWALTDGGEKAYDNQQSVAFTENTTLYALWSLNHHNVTLTQPTVSEVAAGTIKVNNSTTSPASVDYGTTVTLTATENEGYAFDSWSVTGASLASAATVKDNSFTMPDNDVTVTATYHAYTWDLTSYEVTSEVQLSYTDVETFDKNGVVVKANYERSDTKETKQETYESAWTAKLGEDVIAHGYAFTLADNGKHLTFWIGENKIYDEEVEVTEIPKDQYIDKLWGLDTQVKTGDNYTVPSLSNQTLGSSATCKDHNIFMGWVLAANEDEPTGTNVLKAGTTGQEASNRTFYAIWAKTEEEDVPAGYRQITSAPSSGADVILAAKSGTKYYALKNNANNSNDEISLTDGVVTTTTNFEFTFEDGNKFKVKDGSNYIHFNSSELKVANATTNSVVALTASNGTFKICGNSRYMTFNGTSFGVTSTESSYTPIYIFMYQAASKQNVYTDNITDCTPRHTISFNVNGGKGSYDAVEKKEGATITLPVPVEAEYKDWHTYTGWKVNNAGELLETTYTVGDEDVTLYAQWKEVSKADVIFKNGETTVQTKSGIHQGESYDLEDALEAEGKQFTGWKNGDNLYDGGKTGMVMSTPAAEIVYEAQWMTVVPTPTTEVITNADLSNGEWVLVTKANQIHSGDVVILAADGYDKALGAQGSNNYRGNVAITKSADKSKLTEIGDAVKLFVQNGYDDGQFALYDLNTTSGENGYLYHSGSGNTLNTGANVVKNGSWKISVADGVATIQSAGTDYYIEYNASNPRFSCYNGSQQDVALYKWVKTLTSNTNVSDVTLTDAVVVPNNVTLTINNNATLDNVIVEAGGTISGSANLTVNDLTIQTSLGTISGDNNAGGKSGQITNSNITATGDVFIEIELTQASEASYGWYAFSVPFEVDALNGVYYQSTKLANEVGYAIMKYHEDVRAEGKYAWKKYRETLKPGELYIITVADTDYKTLRFKKNAGADLVASNQVQVYKTDHSGEGTDFDEGWNGVGNPNLQVSQYTSATVMQFLDHEANAFKTRAAGDVNLMVGSAFMLQHGSTEKITIAAGNSGSIALAPALTPKVVESVLHEVKLINTATEKEEDNVFFAAREEATNSYEIGRDVAKFSMGTAKCAQMMIPAYGTNLCAADFPLVNDKASYPLTITTPAVGDYRIELAEAYEDATIYLTYEGRVIWNLSMSPYEVELQQGQTGGYGLRLVAAPKNPTDIENTEVLNGANGVQKVIIDEHVYILRGEQLFDVTGKATR